MTPEENARLVWQCRRGMLELDVFLQRFLKQGYDDLNEKQQQAFMQLLELPDQELLEILLGNTSATDSQLNEIAFRIHRSARVSS